jgi:hypothetical protein
LIEVIEDFCAAYKASPFRGRLGGIRFSDQRRLRKQHPAMEKIATYPAPGQCGQKELKGEFSYAHLRVMIDFCKNRVQTNKRVEEGLSYSMLMSIPGLAEAGV